MSYRCGPSVLRLTGHVVPIQPGQIFEHDFSVTGPDGEHGPSRLAASLLSGAILVEPPATSGEVNNSDRAKRRSSEAKE